VSNPGHAPSGAPSPSIGGGEGQTGHPPPKPSEGPAKRWLRLFHFTHEDLLHPVRWEILLPKDTQIVIATDRNCHP
jgi:hypothetical protein